MPKEHSSDKKDKKGKKRHRSNSSHGSKSSEQPPRKKSRMSHRGLQEISVDELLAAQDRKKEEAEKLRREKEIQFLEQEREAHRLKREEEMAAAQANAPTINLPLITASAALTLHPPVVTVNPQLAAVAREGRRLHVSNLPKSVTQIQIRELFETWSEILRRQMIQEESGKVLPDDVRIEADPVGDIFINNNVSSPYAFVEIGGPDLTTRFMSEEKNIIFTSAEGNTYPVKLRRPNNYRDLSAVEPNRLVILGAPDVLDEGQYKELLKKFGEITFFHFIPSRFIVVEFDEDDAVEKCIATLHGVVVGNRVLCLQRLCVAVRVQMQKLGVNIPARAPLEEGREEGKKTAAGTSTALTIVETLTRRDVIKELFDLGVSIPKALTALEQDYPYLKTPAIVPTKILVLFNMIDGTTELEEDEDFYQLLEDVSEEVERYGRVVDVIIPRHAPNPPNPPEPFVPKELPPKPTEVVKLLPLTTPFDSDGAVDRKKSPPAQQERKKPTPEKKSGEETEEKEKKRK